jgi:hypothetical protein
MERASSHAGTPYAMRAIITIGDVKGITDPQIERALSGYWNVCNIRNSPIIRGIVIGKMSCWVSASLSTAAPTAANMLEYNRSREGDFNIRNLCRFIFGAGCKGCQCHCTDK